MASNINLTDLLGTTGQSPTQTLFSSLNINNQSGAAQTGDVLTNYASIKNGSYYKLMKKYYSNDTTNDKAGIEAYKEKQQLVSTKASDFASKINDLMDMTYTDENKEKIASKVEDFVSAYNKMIDGADSSNSKNVIKTSGWLKNMMGENADLLDRVGISVAKDGKLSVDSAKLSDANIDSMKEAFGYSASGFANKVLYKAEQIYSLAATYGTSATAYTSSGSINRNYAPVENSINTTT